MSTGAINKQNCPANHGKREAGKNGTSLLVSVVLHAVPDSDTDISFESQAFDPCVMKICCVLFKPLAVHMKVVMKILSSAF